MDRSDLYDKMADRKFKPKDLEPYDGNNGRVNRCAQLIRQHKLRSGGTLLDVGGGIGDLCHSVRDLFSRTITADISRKNLEAARTKGSEIVWVDVDKSGLNGVEDDSVDLICALDFIEHIVDPQNFAKECRRVLKTSGEVFINTPNIRFIPHVLELLYEGTFPHTSGDREVFHGGHLAFYTYKDLRSIFEPVGFSSAEQFMDDEGYKDPSMYISDYQMMPKTQDEYRRLCMELGCPNLLYKAIVTK
jgi:ubiquinone/menaquinone biosynthesis C-methylase UbiE